MEFSRLTGLLLGLLTAFAGAFVTPVQPLLLTRQQGTLASPLSPLMAGFGASSSKGKVKKEKASKLKPKKQWDRYTSEDLKSADSIRVAVRVVERAPEETQLNNAEKWFSVGEIKSKDNDYTKEAVIRHRALMGDHARRMFPSEVLAIDNLEYGYTTDSDDDTKNCEWNVVGKIEDMPAGIDKMIGFRGFPDLTGFYASSGKAATGDTTQDGYSNMKNKGILGISRLECHD